MEKYLFTSEAVCCGHPDKICDKISDYILDEALRQDMDSRMAVEVSIKGKMIFIYGEASTMAKLCYKDLALKVMGDLGYDDDYEVIVNVSEQLVMLLVVIDWGLEIRELCLDMLVVILMN